MSPKPSLSLSILFRPAELAQGPGQRPTPPTLFALSSPPRSAHTHARNPAATRGRTRFPVVAAASFAPTNATTCPRSAAHRCPGCPPCRAASCSAPAVRDPRRLAPPTAMPLLYRLTPTTAGSFTPWCRSAVLLQFSIPDERAPGSQQTEETKRYHGIVGVVCDLAGG